ncbi:MAG TPA: Gfo/Idh/MocA family oxidoreductase [Acidimicrobiales bacterium]|nr:Gfo/Idh/MocA family oxidoreductase [Acidimicrobiales bacterium]
MVGRSLRVAVVGTGFIGRVHARAARVAGATLAGVVASSAGAGARAAEELGAERAFDTVDQMLAGNHVDVVHVCTPNHLHVPVAMAALEAGAHVVCEKPLAPDTAGARHLVALAAATGRVATVPFVYRFHPVVREARTRVAAGATGPVRLVHGSYLQDWLLGEDDWNWRVDPVAGGVSRAFADIGSHWCDLVEFVTGHRIARVSARFVTTVPERRMAAGVESFGRPPAAGEPVAVHTEDAALVLFETDAGAAGSVVVSQVSAGRKNRLWFEIDGARSSLVFDQEEPETLWIGRREGAELVRRDPKTLSPGAARFATLPAGHAQGYQGCFDAFVADTYAAIAGETPDGLPRFEDGLKSACIVEAVVEAARTGIWVAVPPLPST